MSFVSFHCVIFCYFLNFGSLTVTKRDCTWLSNSSHCTLVIKAQALYQSLHSCSMFLPPTLYLDIFWSWKVAQMGSSMIKCFSYLTTTCFSLDNTGLLKFPALLSEGDVALIEFGLSLLPKIQHPKGADVVWHISDSLYLRSHTTVHIKPRRITALPQIHVGNTFRP